ncbi:SAM-dependent methyltransferase [Amycolatopsis sp. NPDC059021]|uniref:SAM-dependent methyltransferase n=1 Tax=Amycolatopsis sp. NPDC059021 TaxID=3346704 RepID=UPI00366B4460
MTMSELRFSSPPPAPAPRPVTSARTRAAEPARVAAEGRAPGPAARLPEVALPAYGTSRRSGSWYLDREDGNQLAPNPVRVTQALLGMSHPYEADEWMLRRLLEVLPDVAELARAPYRCHERVLRYLASHAGIAQFVLADLLVPPGQPLHTDIRHHAPDATICYIGTEPLALAHARALLTEDNVFVDDADILLPDTLTVLPDLDFDRPVAVLLGTAISHCDDPAARALLARYTQILAPGSILVISGHTAPAAGPRAAIARAVADIHATCGLEPLRFRIIPQLNALLPDTLTALPPGPHQPGGFVPCDRWWPPGPQLDLAPARATARMVSTVVARIEPTTNTEH